MIFRYVMRAWKKWVSVCRKINVFFESLFTRLGYTITSRPKITIIFGVVICFLLTGGFARYDLIQRSEDLYLPQNSQAHKDVDRADKSFPMRYKLEEFILKSKTDNWALNDDVFKTALIIHNSVISLAGYSDICIKSQGDCLHDSPLEYFNYTITNIKNISYVLNEVYNNPKYLSSNGRLAFTNFPNYFAYFQHDPLTREIKRADAFRNVYFVNDPITKDSYKKLTAFENKYIAYMEKMEKTLDAQGLVLLYNCGRSIDISVSDSANKDIKLIPIALILMVLFCGVSLARFRNRVLGHFTLGLGGVFTLFLGIISAFSFIMLVGGPYVAFAGVLPFLILGVGIDNMFIIIDAVDRQHPTLSSSARIAKALGEVGTSITMTTLTDLVAFFVSMVTDFPAIRYFCMYAAVSITFCYVLVITVFVAFLSLDVARIEARRRDFLPCMKEEVGENEEEVWQEGNETVSNKIMSKYAEILTKLPVKVVVIIISLLLLAFGVYGAINVDQSFDQLVLGLKGSAYVKYFRYRNDAYPTGIPVSVIIDQPINYTDSRVQQKYSELSDIAKQNKFMKPLALNWLQAFLFWANHTGKGTTGQSFYPTLYEFLQHNPTYYRDLKVNQVTQKIEASRIMIYTRDSPHSIYRKDAMLTLRKDLDSKTTLPVCGVAYPYIYVEQFVVILSDTIRNLAICASAILLITLPYLVDPKVTFFVFFGFVSLMFELFGVMYLWGVSLNAISMIIIVMGIGFSVDYSAHIAHAFVVSNEKTADKRIVYALKTMGASVTMGGVSTFIGVIVTAFSSSELFKIFFKMVFGIVVLGLIHGLLFLPVFLAVCCQQNIKIVLEDKDENLTNEELLEQNPIT